MSRTGSSVSLARAVTWCALTLITLAAAGLDIYTKTWAFERVAHPTQAIPVIDGFFYITRATNTGAMWSLLQGVQREVWIAVRGGVFLILLLLVVRSRTAARWAVAGFVLVLAGALGNLYDNVFYVDGAVRDWLRFDFGDWTFPVFNLADSYICIGAPLLLIHFYRDDRKPAEKKE